MSSHRLSSRPWEFSIDVGGTFTDCIVLRPDGVELRLKTLSSGVFKGKAAPPSDVGVVYDPLRGGEPADFWRGFHLDLLDSAGRSLARALVGSSDGRTGRLQLATPLASHPLEAAGYELSCHLDAPVLAIRYLMGLPLDKVAPPVALRLGTTRGTNALLTRSGAKTALLTTRGFGDALAIGYQERPRLFDLAIVKSAPLAYRTIEVEERVGADGQTLIAPCPVQIRRQLTELLEEGCRSAAICLLHADLYPAHERLIAELAREMGFIEITCSSDASRLPKFVARAETTVADAYLGPVVREYVERLQGELPGSRVRLMTSSGGLCAPSSFRGCQSILSGPAGGAVGYSRASAAAGFERAIGFDMGGTSTDVSRFDGRLELEYESRKADVRLMVPTLAIDTVAAGGGSVCWFDGIRLGVGPHSAGAEPGPACYGRGGPLTVTDVNFFLGRLAADRFPFALVREAVEQRLTALAGELVGVGESLTLEQLALGLLEIANANMARAIRNVTVAKGFDPRDYVLVAFGGAAGQHACAVADQLGIATILDPADAGVLSARGIGQADVVRYGTTSVQRRAADVTDAFLADAFAELEAAARRELHDEGFDDAQIFVRRSVEVRYAGVDASLDVEWTPGSPWRERFNELHTAHYGYRHDDRPLEAAAVRVAVRGESLQLERRSVRSPRHVAQPDAMGSSWFAEQRAATPLFNREALRPGAQLIGPALVASQHATLVVESGWQAEMLSEGELLLTRCEAAIPPSTSPPHARLQPQVVQAEVFHNLLAGIADRMGRILQRTALSVNVKERLDFSCALFTGHGELVANAPHVPVHLGAMGATVRAVLRNNPSMRAGDVYLTNDPYAGGSHLPDLTVVAPLFPPGTDKPALFTAVRAHHAEIGGVRPGSMPPFSRHLEEEGVVIRNFLLIRDDVLRESALRDLLLAPPYPSRRVEENLADVRAQVAAARQGANDLLDLAVRHGWKEVADQMVALQQSSEALVRRAIDGLPAGPWEFADVLELPGGAVAPIAVRIDRLAPGRSSPASSVHRSGPALRIDFTGSGPVVDGNLNANDAIVSAAVLYVLRLLVAEEIPLNEGALRAVELVLPPGLLNPPVAERHGDSPAVAAGNVETSQRIVDVLLGAFGLAAASQGTMNNFLFGNADFSCYETIGGGSGAIRGADGADAVQVHMTNTRATDPEILERRMPVRLWEFAIRRGSGGEGRWRGGDGIVRRLEFLASAEASLLSQRRQVPPFGMAGGLPGAVGENWVVRGDGTVEKLPGFASLHVEPGDQVTILTPGGGGFGISAYSSGSSPRDSA